MLTFYDTSALMHLEKPLFGEAYISPTVFQELEGIKTSVTKDEQRKYFARRLINDLIASDDYTTKLYAKAKIDKVIHDNHFLYDIPDHRLIAEAILVEAEHQNELFKFVTCDGAQYLIAKAFPQLNAEFIGIEEENGESDYIGWGKYYPTEEQMAALYSNPEFNLFGAKTNEYLCIYENSKDLKDILRWDGERYCRLNYKDINIKNIGLQVRPRNIQQKMVMDLLQNPDIPVKLVTGVYGSGKDYVMMSQAIDLVMKGKKNRIVFIRNLIDLKDTPQIGYLPGESFEKIGWGLDPIKDLLGGQEGLDMFTEEGQIEAANLGFCRGRSWSDTIVYVTEGQNMTTSQIKLLISRLGEGSELWINGDYHQTDKSVFDRDNGIKMLQQRLGGNPMFGCVDLIKTERSKQAELATLLD